MIEGRSTVSGFLLVLLFVAVAGCAVQRGTVHEVKRGQTLWTIARTYDVDLDALIRVNDIREVRRVRPGTRLVIPGARRPREVPRLRPKTGGSGSEAGSSSAGASRSSSGGSGGGEDPPGSGRASDSAGNADPESPDASEGELAFNPRWPCRGSVISGFKKNGGPAHRGVLIGVEKGEEVLAAEEGNVKLAGEWDRLPQLGKIVIIFHTDDLTTVYAHLKSIRVSEGDRVQQGDPIGIAGTSGEVSRPVCYFETRYRLEPRDPLIFLEEPT